MKQCIKCNEVKNLESFYKDRSENDRYNKQCKECCNKPKNRLTLLKQCAHCNKDYIQGRQPNQRFCSKNCSIEFHKKQLKQNTEVGRFRILKRDEFRCIYCGMSSIENASELHVDHIIPYSVCKENIASNLVTACNRCNIEKATIELDDETKLRILKVIEDRNLLHGLSPILPIKLGGRS